MANSDRTVWDEKCHLDLLQSMVTTLNITVADWDSVIESIKKKGYNYTSSAAMYCYLFFI